MEQESEHKQRKHFSDEEIKNRVALQKAVGRKLYNLRYEKNHDQTSVAKEIDISASTLSKIENGNHKLDINIILRLAAYYKKPIDYFLPPPYNIMLNIICKLKKYFTKPNFQVGYIFQNRK